MILRDYQVSDRNELSLICSDIEVMKYVFNGPIPINEFDAFMRTISVAQRCFRFGSYKP